MPYSLLTDEQILALLAEQPKMICVPGVALVLVEYLDSRTAEIALVATVFPGNHQEIRQLPTSVAGIPVIVKIEDRRTGQVVEIIDPRNNGGAWPH